MKNQETELALLQRGLAVLVLEFQHPGSSGPGFCTEIINTGFDRELTFKNNVTDLHLACSRDVASMMRIGEKISHHKTNRDRKQVIALV